MLEYCIRDACEADLLNVVKHDIIMLGETLGYETLREYLTSDLMKYFVIELNETKDFIGVVSLWVDENKAQINNIYIIQNYQGKKLGKVLMDYVMKYFKLRNINEVTLEVRKSNEIAIKMYESYGFELVTLRKNYYSNGEDALFMYLRIGCD